MKRGLILLSALLLFAANVAVILPFISDDALISLRYSHRFASGSGLTWNDGERVEGYSNLLWVLLSSVLMSAGVEGTLAVRALGILFSMLFILTVFLHYRGRGLPALIPVLFASASAPLAAWAVGGLEQPLVLFLVSLSVPLLWRAMEGGSRVSWVHASIPLALLCVTRPDGALFTASAFAGAIMAGKGRKAFLLLPLPVLLFAGQTFFRLFYYGDWIPNTARIKVQPSLTTFKWGVKYVAGGVIALLPLSLITAAGLLKRNRKLLPPAFMAVSWLIYLVVIGGDIFPAWRHFLPVLALFTWISSEVLSSGRRKVILPLIVALPLLAVLQYSLPGNRAALEEDWEWDARITALALRQGFMGSDPLLAVTAAGSLPYWTGFRTVDMLGLNDRHLASHPGVIGTGCLAWHGVCNPEYVLSRQPDIVSFNAAGDTTGLPVARALVFDPEFSSGYSRIILRGDQPFTRYGMLWFRRESDAVGFSVEGDTVRVPAWFLNEGKRNHCSLFEGRPGVLIQPDRPASGAFPEIDPAEWAVMPVPGVSFTLEPLAGGSARIEARSETAVFLRELVLVRQDG